MSEFIDLIDDWFAVNDKLTLKQYHNLKVVFRDIKIKEVGFKCQKK